MKLVNETSFSVAVIGGGSFGTVLANLVAMNGFRVTMWVRRKSQVVHINQHHKNEQYLTDFLLHNDIVATSSYKTALNEVSLVFVAVPSAYFRSVVKEAAQWLEGKMIVSVTKGIETETFDLMSEILLDELSSVRIGALSGPNLAQEIAMQELTATVIASEDRELQSSVRRVLQNKYFRVYDGRDIYGIELAGALKNIYAIASGLCVFLKVGENTMSMLLTRSLAEMSRFAVRLGANPMTFLGLAGIGDLIATCTSRLSRNFCLGYALGGSLKLEEAQQQLGGVVEGVNTLQQVIKKAEQIHVRMPIALALYQIVFHEKPATWLFEKMMEEEGQLDVE